MSATSGDENARMQPGVINKLDERFADAMGWFSIGLGVAELIAPRAFTRFLGVKDQPALVRLLGVRELASGLGIVTQRRPAEWLWSRVGGDMMDLALLGMAASSDRARHGRVAAVTAAVAGITILDVICSGQFSHGAGATAEDSGIEVKRTVTIGRTPEELYKFWRDFQNLPRIMKHLKSVEVTGEKRSHWIACGPAVRTVEWDAEITQESPNELIAWRSLEGADVDNYGSVRFERAPGARGTVVRVDIHYSPPGGTIGALVAKLFGEAPEQQIQEDLYRFKQLMETGEIATTEGQPSGRGARR
jgi:uncharacterized membrane protein